jgi:carbon monoxide dehydrogenase subunit G
VLARKTSEETVVVEGDRKDWLEECRTVMTRQGFKAVTCNDTLYQINGDWKRPIGTVWGKLQVTLLPEGDGKTRLQITGTGTVDGVLEAFGSPGKKLIDKFKNGIKARDK